MGNDNLSKKIGTVQHRAADYLEVAEWSNEDNCYVGSVPPLVGPSCDRSFTDVAELFFELDEIAEEYLSIFAEDGFLIPPPSTAEVYNGQFVGLVGKHILRCRLMDATGVFLSDGMFQNEGGVHKPCFMPLPRISSLDETVRSRGSHLRFSSTLIVPIGGLKPLGNGSFEVVGCAGSTPPGEESSMPSGKIPETALHLIRV